MPSLHRWVRAGAGGPQKQVYCSPGTCPLPRSVPSSLPSGAGEGVARRRHWLRCCGPQLRGQAHLCKDRAGSDVHGPQPLPVSLALGPSQTPLWGGRGLSGFPGLCRGTGLWTGSLYPCHLPSSGQDFRAGSASRWPLEPEGRGVRPRPGGREELVGRWEQENSPADLPTHAASTPGSPRCQMGPWGP